MQIPELAAAPAASADSGGGAVAAPAADVQQFSSLMQSLAVDQDSVFAETARAALRYLHPSLAKERLGELQTQLSDSFNAGLPSGFSGFSVPEQMAVMTDVYCRVVGSQTTLNATSMVINGVQKIGETILNKQG